MITENLSTLKIHKLTKAQYERELAAGTIDSNALYLTPDEEIDLSGYVTAEQLATKADSDHNHDDTYYTEVEVDTLLASKADATHNHDNVYDVKGSAGSALDEAKSYTDSVVSGKADSTHIHTISDVTDLTEVLEDKSNIGHTHTVSQISDLTASVTELNYMDGVTSNVQNQLDGKASSSHSHTITADASDDDVVILTGTNGTDSVTYSASHADSGVTSGTYKSVTVNAKGHVTSGSNPTTLDGYGITDAYTKAQIDSTVDDIDKRTVMVVNITLENGAYKADKLMADIVSHYNNGGSVVARYTEFDYSLRQMFMGKYPWFTYYEVADDYVEIYHITMSSDTNITMASNRFERSPIFVAPTFNDDGTELTAGVNGLVPAPDSSSVDIALFGNGEWKEVYTKEEADVSLDGKMDMTNPTGSGSFSLNRVAESTVGNNSIAIGYHTEASGNAAVAIGYGTTASGNFSYAEGRNTTASARDSHAEGYGTTASGNFSHVEGICTVASGMVSHVQGKYNISDDSAHIVGNGTAEDALSNAHTLDWDGNAWFAGDVYVGSTSGTNKDDGSVKLVVETTLNNYYTKEEIDVMEFITVNDIDTICGITIESGESGESSSGSGNTSGG